MPRRRMHYKQHDLTGFGLRHTLGGIKSMHGQQAGVHAGSESHFTDSASSWMIGSV